MVLYFLLAVAALIVAVVLGLLAAGAPKESSRDQMSRGSFITGSVLSVVALIGITLAFAATTVAPRAVGIETSFGKYRGTLPAGFHWTAPWANVEEFPTQVQFLELNGKEDGAGGVAVNFSGGGKGTVDATVRWKIEEKDAEALWRKYKDFDKVRDQLVTSAARDAVRLAVGGYTPTAAQSGKTGPEITRAIQGALQAAVSDDGVQVDSLSVTAVILDDNTQKAIEQVIIAQQGTAKAEEEKKRASTEKETNKLRQDGGLLSPDALRRYCLEVTNNWDQGKNGPLPAGWSCMAQAPFTVTK